MNLPTEQQAKLLFYLAGYRVGIAGTKHAETQPDFLQGYEDGRDHMQTVYEAAMIRYGDELSPLR